jgi:hypothetical protein
MTPLEGSSIKEKQNHSKQTSKNNYEKTILNLEQEIDVKDRKINELEREIIRLSHDN